MKQTRKQKGFRLEEAEYRYQEYRKGNVKAKAAEFVFKENPSDK